MRQLLAGGMLLSFLLMGIGALVPRFQCRSVWGLVLVFGGAVLYTLFWCLSGARL